MRPTTLRRGEQDMSHTYTLSHQSKWNNIFRQWKLPLYFSKPAQNHIAHFVDGMLSESFSGTLTDIHRESLHSRDRRSISHFLSHGDWNEQHLDHIVQTLSYKEVSRISKQHNNPMFVLLDDTVCEKTKPSSQALFSMQGTSYHHSHLKGKTVYGHAAVEMMIRSGDTVYPFAMKRFDPNGLSKIEIASQMIQQVPRSNSHKTYVLMDSWYPSTSILETCTARGFHAISGLKTNRIIYPQGIRQQIKEFTSYIKKSDTDLVTIGTDDYRIYRYEGKLNLMDNAVVLLCWKDGDELKPANVRAFLSTDVSLTINQILNFYSKRWSIETYFRTAKVHLGLDRYQVRSVKSIDRYWALLLFASFCCTYCGCNSLIDGLHQYRKQKKDCWIEFIYNEAQSGSSLTHIKTQLRVA